MEKRRNKYDGLIIPPKLKGYTDSQIEGMSNGCGPQGYGWMVPDRFRLIGLNFTPACDIHDVCYQVRMPKEDADKIFEKNLTIIARRSHTGPLGEWLAYIYYSAVRYGGSGAYNKGKEA